MSRVQRTVTVNPDELGDYLTPRDGLVREQAAGDGVFTAVEGPVHEYRRTVTLEPAGDGQVRVHETIEFRLAAPYWRFIFVPLYRYGLARRARAPWWAPPQRLDPRAATALGALAVVAVLNGYLGTLLTQTVTFAADEFDASNFAQGVVGFVVRVGGMLAFFVVALADRRGRRALLLWAVALSCVTAATGALAPSLAGLAATQVVSRGFASAVVVLVAINTAEEMPRGARAYAVSLLVLAAGLGAGLAVLALPLADVGEWGWRLVYVVPLLGLPMLRSVARCLPESRRFEAPHDEVPLPGHGRRFWLLAGGAFLLNLYIAPSSLFQNDFLKDERGFSGVDISVFTLVTGTPAAIGVVIGGRLADVRGRRTVAVTALTLGTLLLTTSFFTHGWPLWAWTLAGGIVANARAPVILVYGPELFPTSLRGRANGLINVIALLGSSVGLLAAGVLSDVWDELGPAMAVVAVGPIALAVLIAVAYPETARRELEELNPEDRRA